VNEARIAFARCPTGIQWRKRLAEQRGRPARGGGEVGLDGGRV